MSGLLKEGMLSSSGTTSDRYPFTLAVTWYDSPDRLSTSAAPERSTYGSRRSGSMKLTLSTLISKSLSR